MRAPGAEDQTMAQSLDMKPAPDPLDVLHRAGMSLDNAPDLPRRVRRFVRQHLEEWAVGSDCVETILLLTSEVITNALHHAAPPLDLTLTHGTFGVNVDVTDSSRILPEVRHADDDHEGGRGLWLVAALATAWGLTVSAERKSVWFTLAPAAGRRSRRAVRPPDYR